MVWLPGLGPGVAVMVLAVGFVTGVRRMPLRRGSAGVAGMAGMAGMAMPVSGMGGIAVMVVAVVAVMAVMAVMVVMVVMVVMAGVAVTGDGAVCRLRGRPVFLS